MLTARWLLSISLATVLAFAAVAASAHHGRGNRYDMNAEIPIVGTVRELVWRNPHIAIVVDVESDDGEVVPWVIEHSNVSTLARMGYHRNSLRPGQAVTIFINPGTGGEPIGLCQRIVLEDGTVIFVRGETVD
jgi:hypothetical protein